MTGSLELDGQDIRALGPVGVAERVGLVLQDPSAQLVMERVEDDVAFGLENRAWPLADMRARVPEALADGRPGRHGAAPVASAVRRPAAAAGAGRCARSAAGAARARRADRQPRHGRRTQRSWRHWRRLRDAAGRPRSCSSSIRSTLAWPLADIVLALGQDGTTIDVGAPQDVLARSGDRMRAAGIWLPGEVSSRPRNRSSASGPDASSERAASGSAMTASSRSSAT